MCWFLRSNYYFINILIDSYCGHSSAVCRLKSSFVKNKIFRSVVVLVASPMNVYNLVFNTVFTFALFWLLWHLKPTNFEHHKSMTWWDNDTRKGKKPLYDHLTTSHPRKRQWYIRKPKWNMLCMFILWQEWIMLLS